MNRVTTRKLVIDGLLIALVFIATKFTTIPGPVPPGYLNLGDAIIIIAAILFGGRTGMIAGAIGSALADITALAYVYAPVTFLVKGLEGLIIGIIISKIKDKVIHQGIMYYVILLFASIIGAIIMVAGYFAAEAFILGLFDRNLGLAAAIFNLPLNLIQGVASVAVGYSLALLLLKVDVKKQLQV